MVAKHRFTVAQYDRMIADYLARSRKVQLALLSRREFPPRERWDNYIGSASLADPTADQIRRVLAGAVDLHGAGQHETAGELTSRPAHQFLLIGQLEVHLAVSTSRAITNR